MGFFKSIGKVLGGVAGAAIGSVVPGVGTLAGFQIGSAVGGLASGASGSKKAGAARSKAGSLQQQELNFSLEQYDEWKALYGDLESNLSDFYTNLDEDFIATTGLQNFQGEFQTAVKNVDEDFVRRGISPDSGIAADKAADLELARAERRAEIISEAPLQTAQLQTDFLSLGLSQKSGVAGRVSGSLLDSATSARKDAAELQAASGRVINNSSAIIGDVLGGIFDDSRNSNKDLGTTSREHGTI